MPKISKYRWIEMTLSICFLLLCGYGCGKSDQNDDHNLNWGVFRDTSHLPRVGLLNLKPDSKICVTGYQADLAKWAITRWAEEAGRISRLKIENCFEQNSSITVRLTGPMDSICSRGAAAQTDTLSNIKVCGEFSGAMLKHILLHEVGHLWGLCDQYDGGSNCQGGFVNNNSIMGAGQGISDLTKDDIQGILAITRAKGIPHNELWRAIQDQAKPGVRAPNLDLQTGQTQWLPIGTGPTPTTPTTPTVTTSSNPVPPPSSPGAGQEGGQIVGGIFQHVGEICLIPRFQPFCKIFGIIDNTP